MPALPFFALLAPSTSATSNSPLTPNNVSNGADFGPLSAFIPATQNSEDGAPSVAFWQQLQTAIEQPPLPVGQELAAFVQQPSFVVQRADDPNAQIVMPMTLDTQVDTTESNLSIAPQLPPAQTDTIEKDGFEYLETLRQADPHVQNKHMEHTTVNSLTAAQPVEHASSQVEPVIQQSTTGSSASPINSPLTPVVEANAVVSPSAMAEQASKAAAVQNPGVIQGQDKKMINLEQLGFDPNNEEADLSDLEINLDDLELNQAKSDNRSIHEKPMTLTAAKEASVSQTTAQVEPSLSHDTKSIPSDVATTLGKDTQVNSKSMALEQPTVQQTQTLEQAKASFNKLDVPPQHPQWNDQVAKRISIMAGESIQTARIQLDPPELGALEVKVKVQNDQVSVSFGSNNQMVRDALEGQSPRLRELLEQQGINLADVNVSEHGGHQGGEQPGQEGFSGATDAEAFVDGESNEQVEVVNLESDSLVDYFA